MDLATHLKSFLTPGQIETLTLALENIEVRASMRATPPKSSEPEKVEAVAAKVFEFQDGDVVTNYREEHLYLYRNGDVFAFARPGNDNLMSLLGKDQGDRHGERIVDRPEIEARLATLGYVAKWPTPASDSVKWERDRHGRTIIARNDFAMVVECGSNKEDDGRFQISSACGTFWYVGREGYWLRNQHPDTGVHTAEWCMKNLPQAANVPIPTANPAASAKHDPFPMGAGDVTGPGESPWEAIGKLAGEIYELKREVAALKAVK